MGSGFKDIEVKFGLSTLPGLHSLPTNFCKVEQIGLIGSSPELNKEFLKKQLVK